MQTNLDGENDDNEFFTLDLFKSEADWEDGNYETFGEAYIANNGMLPLLTVPINIL